MIVIDASAMIELLCRTEKADRIAQRISLATTRHAPHLIDVEVASGLRRQCFLKSLTVDRAAEALGDLRDFPLTRHPHTPLLSMVWQLRSRFTAYDATYLALAKALSAPLLTCDGALAEAGKFVEIF